MAEYQSSYQHKIHFGGNREAAIQRDGERCVHCGMTREEHKAKFGRDITVDHIDGKGRHTPIAQKNNDLSNLQTLCLPCHGRKDTKRRWSGSRRYRRYFRKITYVDAQEIRRLVAAKKYKQKELAKVYAVSAANINKIVRNKIWIR